MSKCTQGRQKQHERGVAARYDGGYFIMDDLRFIKIFNLGITLKDISRKKLLKLEKRQSLVAKCCKIRKI